MKSSYKPYRDITKKALIRVRLVVCLLGIVLLLAGILNPFQTSVTEASTIMEQAFILNGRWFKTFPIDINVTGKTSYKLTITFSSNNTITAAIITDSTMFAVTHDIRASIVCEAWLPSSKAGSFDYAPQQSGRYWIFFGNVQARQMSFRLPRFELGWIDQVSQITFIVKETYVNLKLMTNWPLIGVGILILVIGLVAFLLKREVIKPTQPLY